MKSISEDNGIAFLKPDDLKVYSVGISTGGHAEIRMAKLNSSRSIIATTIDREGAKFAESTIEEKGLSKQIIVKIEDVSTPLSYADHSFDFCYARLVLHYLSKIELKRALDELNRILKAYGRLFIVVRSAECLAAKSPNALYDPLTGFTTSESSGIIYRRYFHTEDSIRKHLMSSKFSISHIKSYDEHLCEDFQRTKLSAYPDALIEVLATKSP